MRRVIRRLSLRSYREAWPTLIRWREEEAYVRANGPAICRYVYRRSRRNRGGIGTF
jgi:hypothetical protein